MSDAQQDDSVREVAEYRSAGPGESGAAKAGDDEPAVVVAVDGSPASLVALQTAARLAALLHASLAVVFVEDENLLRLGGLPFCREVGAYTASVRLLDRAGMEREMRALGQRVRRMVAPAAEAERLAWRFSVRRGHVAEELSAEASRALLLGVGRVGRLAGQLGSTPRRLIAGTAVPLLVAPVRPSRSPTLTLLDTGSEPSQRARALAFSLAAGLAQSAGELRVQVLALPGAQESRGEDTRDSLPNVSVAVAVVTAEQVAAALSTLDGLLLLPADALTGPLSLESLPTCALLIVP